MLRTLNDIGESKNSLSLSYVTKLTNQGITPEPTEPAKPTKLTNVNIKPDKLKGGACESKINIS